MRRHWPPLVTWVSLAAFLLANTPGALVAAAYLLGGRPRHGHACQHVCCHSCGHEAASGCTAGETTPYTTDSADSESHISPLVQVVPSQECDSSPCQSCPCSTGSCGHCGITKVPCCS